VLVICTFLAFASCSQMGRKYIAFDVESVPSGAGVEVIMQNRIGGGLWAQEGLGKTPTGIKVRHFAFGAPGAGSTRLGVRVDGMELFEEIFFETSDWYDTPKEAMNHVKHIVVPQGVADAGPAETGPDKGEERMAVKSGPRNENRVLAGSEPMNVRNVPIKRYIATKIGRPIKLDGKLDEAMWKAAPSTGAFVEIMTGNPGGVTTEAKLLWDNKNLYIGFENADSDVWAQHTERDARLWTQEAVDVMIDADGNGKTYIDLQVAPNGTIFDTYLPAYRKYEDSLGPNRKPYDWDSKLKAAVKVDGTLNKRDDQDRGWTVEIALPLVDANGMEKPGAKTPPAVGDMWRINMYRLDSPKDKDKIAVVWSAPMVGDFHKLDRFGELVFGDEKGEVPPKVDGKDDKASTGKNDRGANAGKGAEKGAPTKQKGAQ
jgi:hypothetical protein